MKSPNRFSTFAGISLIAALIAIAMVVGAGPAYRFGVLGLGPAFGAIGWGAWLGVAAVVVALLTLWLARRDSPRRGIAISLAAIVLGALAFGVPFALLQRAKQAPPIHDIATDTSDPPRFVAVIPLRRDARNSTDYGGEAVAAEQRAAFPDIQPLMLSLPPDRAFARALDAARQMGWEIAANVPAEGRIEATDTTPWFGFKDDIVVRVRPAPGGSRVDVRSESRIGGSDLGKNARRVREYLRKLRA